MPRTHLPGASTLRNRNRITNKTRLKIIKGNLDSEDLFIPDEDEEKHRLTNLVAGVDAEDANEHHLQEVLSAAHRNGAATKKTEEKPTAYIPTPDSTGVVDNAEELYPPGRWRDPATYVCTSTGVEEAVANGIANGFTYYMGERDKDWLDKNNEEARGEGTSAQGAVSASGTRTSSRSAKAKGKEPDVNQPTTISEDEFELVMGLFEKVTHDKTEFLHHSLETGMPFPAFADYQDTFANPLTPGMFAAYTVPDWIPQPQQLLRIARTIYPYWKERRIERAGHRIIPTLNFDESDTLNESYICFRRREIKAVRKTRQTQVTFSDKLVRLQAEFAYPLELAKLVLRREEVKRENAQQGQQVWERRMALADLKRRFPTFSDKTDDDLLVDKERKKPEKPIIRVQRPEVLTPIPQVIIKPRERIAQVKAQVDATLAKQKEADRSWEDVIDNPYQTLPVPYASRLFQYIPPSDSPSFPTPSSDKTSDSEDEPPAKIPRVSRAVRLRYGRGGRMVMDRRDDVRRRPVLHAARSSLFCSGDDDGMDIDDKTPEDPEEAERVKRLEERWKYDSDDAPPCGPGGPDEQDRALVDDYDPKYLRYAMTLFREADHIDLSTDPTLYLPTASGHQTSVVPYRLGLPPMMRRDQQGNLRPIHPIHGMFIPGSMPLHPSMAGGGTPVSMQHQVKKMAPPSSLPQMRISSNGGMRPPSVPANAVAAISGQQQSASTSQLPSTTQLSHNSIPNGINGVARPAIAMPHVDLVKPAEPMINGGSSLTPPMQSNEVGLSQSQDTSMGINGAGPARPKSQNQTPVALSVPTNGYHLTQMTPATAAAYAQLQQGNQRTPMSMAKMQELKSAFASLQANLTPQDMAVLQAHSAQQQSVRPVGAGGYGHTNGNLPMPSGNLKLPPQSRWSLGVGVQRPGSAVNGDGQSPSPQMIPVRSPSANGIRPGMRIGSNGQLQMSPHLQHTPSPMPNISQSQSPPRLPMTPTMTMASPPQQAVGSTQNGY